MTAQAEGDSRSSDTGAWAQRDPFGLVGQTVGERYVVLEAVARGGFGIVYRAQHIDLGSAIALKVLTVPPMARDERRLAFLENFRREARTVAALDHPAVVRVVDFGSLRTPDGEAPWMAMEWIDGETLEDDLAARRTLSGRSPREVFALLRPAFAALADAHDAGIAHRDLKPANFMLARNRRGDTALRVLDFGIAKVMSPNEEAGTGQTETRSDLAAYTPGYAAPEQVSRARTGPWTDVHALALIVTELLCDRAPYGGEDPTAAFAAVFLPTRPTPARFGVGVGPWEDTLARALAIRPTERQLNAATLLAELEAGLDEAERAWRGELTAPASTPTPRRADAPDATPPTPRRWALFAGAALATVALLAAGIALTRRDDTPVPRTDLPVAARPAAPRPAPTAAPSPDTAPTPAPAAAPAPEPAAPEPAAAQAPATTPGRSVRPRRAPRGSAEPGGAAAPARIEIE